MYEGRWEVEYIFFRFCVFLLFVSCKPFCIDIFTEQQKWGKCHSHTNKNITCINILTVYVV